MTKKDYELIASVLASENRFTFRRSIEAHNAGDKEVERAQANRQYEVGQIAKILARKFKQENPLFDESKWFAAVNSD